MQHINVCGWWGGGDPKPRDLCCAPFLARSAGGDWGGIHPNLISTRQHRWGYPASTSSCHRETAHMSICWCSTQPSPDVLVKPIKLYLFNRISANNVSYARTFQGEMIYQRTDSWYRSVSRDFSSIYCWFVSWLIVKSGVLFSERKLWRAVTLALGVINN